MDIYFSNIIKELQYNLFRLILIDTFIYLSKIVVVPFKHIVINQFMHDSFQVIKWLKLTYILQILLLRIQLFEIILNG